mmetsp:Transcript_24532/g.37328  ORF Transcript_24532/g.37328 Transcript_24532/m.37328 type:complete len:179 (-) Transcript_24532:189-725(-)
MWIHAPEESRESVMLRLSARNGGTVSIVKLGRSPNESAAKSIQVFFSYVSRYLKYQDHFKDAVFLMQGVDIGVFDEYDRPVGNGAWDIYAQLGEDRFSIHYWAVHNGTRNGNHDAIAYTSIPKYSTFVHFSPCGQKFFTMDISDKAEIHNSRNKVPTRFYRTDIRGKRKWDSHNIVEP